MKKSFALFASLLGLTLLPANAAMVITEWMYNGSEFVEFTNTGSTSVNMSGWNFSDSSRGSAGFVDLSAYGVVAAGQSVILSEATTDAFRAVWGTLAGVSIIGGNTQNLSRSDEINLYDNAGTLVDRLTFGDQTFPGTIRADGGATRPGTASTNPANYGTGDLAGWVASTTSDGISFQALSSGFIGSPGVAVIPEPSALMLALLGGLGLLRRRR